MSGLRIDKLNIHHRFGASIGAFLANCALTRAARNCHTLRRPGSFVVGFILPEGAEPSFYEIAAKHLAYRHSRIDDFGRRDTVVLSSLRGPQTRRYNNIDLKEAIKEFSRVVIVADSRDALPEDFDLMADDVVEVGPILARDVKGAVKVCLGQHVSDEQAEIIASMPHDMVALALRRGRSLNTAIEAMKARQEEKEAKTWRSGPRLEGPIRPWGSGGLGTGARHRLGGLEGRAYRVERH